MKHINFITSLSLKQHRSLRLWWYFSCVVFVGLLIAIIVLESIQLYGLYKMFSEHRYLQKQNQSIGKELEPYKALKKQEESLRIQRTKIDRIHNKAEQIRALFEALYVPDLQDIQIQSCKFSKTNFEYVMQCLTVASALNEVKRLQTSKQFHEIQLVSLQQSHNGTQMIATMQGKIQKI